MNYFSGESPENYEQKCLCTLVLDVSASMQGSPIKELNEGLKQFHQAILDDISASSRLELSVITFGSEVKTVLEPTLVENFEMPNLSVSGLTPLADAIELSIDKTEERKLWYKETGQPYYRPFIVLITDGEPSPGQDIEGISKKVRQGVTDKKFIFWTMGIKGYNHTVLSKICPPTAPPLPLDGYKFSAFFTWLSNSISIINKSKEGDQVDLPPVSDWAQIKF